MNKADAYISGWRACMSGVDGRYTPLFEGDPLEAKELLGAWQDGWFDAMEAEDGKEPEPECAGYDSDISL